MAKKTIARLDANPEYFSGQAAVILFDQVTNYSTATFQSITNANPVTVGNIESGTTTSTSEAGEETTIENEQGVTVISETGAGSVGFEFTLMSTSPTVLKKFMKAADVAIAQTTEDGIMGIAQGVGMGNDIPSFEAPIAILNSDKTQMMLYPRARISSSFTGSPGLGAYMGIAVTVRALEVDTANLNTVMKVSGTGAAFE